MNFSQILKDLAEAIARADEAFDVNKDSADINAASNINNARKPFLCVLFEFLADPKGAAIGLWLIDEAGGDRGHEATLWQIVPNDRDALGVSSNSDLSRRPAVAKVNSAALTSSLPLADQTAIRKAFPVGLTEFAESNARSLFAACMGCTIDFRKYRDILLPLQIKKAKGGKKYIGIVQLIARNSDPAEELRENFDELASVTDVIAALIEAGRHRRTILAIGECQKTLLMSRSSENLAVALSRELIGPCSALSCAIYRPGRGDTLVRIAQASDGGYESAKIIERGSFTYWVYERALDESGLHALTHFSNLSREVRPKGSPAVLPNTDLPEPLSADRTSWISFAMLRDKGADASGQAPILFIRLLTAPHRDFLGGSFSTTARDIVKTLSNHVSEVFSRLFEREDHKRVVDAARTIRAQSAGSLVNPIFGRLECGFAKLVGELLFCVKEVYVVHRSTATGAVTTFRDCDDKPVACDPPFHWASNQNGQRRDFAVFGNGEGVDYTVGTIDNFEYGLRCLLGRRFFAGFEWRVLEHIVQELQLAQGRSFDLSKTFLQIGEIRHALRAEMNGVLGHLRVAREIYETCLDLNRKGNMVAAARELLVSGRFRKSIRRSWLSSEELGSVLENSAIYINEMQSEKLQRSRINISRLLKDMRVAFMPELERREIGVFDNSPDGIFASCDNRLVRMALFNLFDNAVKYSFSRNPITVKATDHGSHVSVAITNIGPYIKPADIPKIFQPFERVTFDGFQPMPGTGLGLPVAKKIADVHEGRIGVKSEPFRVGEDEHAETTFTFLIPKGIK